MPRALSNRMMQIQSYSKKEKKVNSIEIENPHVR